MSNPERIQYEDINRLAEGDKAADKLGEQEKVREIGQHIIAKLRESETFNPSRGGFTMSPDTTRDVLRRVNTLKSLKDAERYKEEFDKQYEEIKGNIRNYFGQLDQHSDVFGKRAGNDTLQEYKEQFAQLKPAEQKTWLNKLSEEITSRRNLHDELQRLVGKDHTKEFDQLRRTEKRSYLDQLKGNITTYEKALDKNEVKGRERTDALRIFQESTLKHQKELLRKAEKENDNEKSDKTGNLEAQFKQFSKERQNTFKQFSKLDAKGKREMIAAMRDDLRNEYRGKFEECPHLNKAEKRECAQVVTGNFNIKTAELCMQYFDQHAKKPAEIMRKSMDFPPEIREQYNLKEMRYEEKELALKEMKEHMKHYEEFKKETHKSSEKKLITKKAEQEYNTWYQKLKLPDKKRYKRGSELHTRMEQRKIELAKFEKQLSKPIQKEYAEKFYNSDLDQRIRLNAMLKQASEAYTGKYNQKAGQMVKKGLLAQKSAESWMRNFKSNLTLNQQARLSVFDPNLEAPFRQILLDHFKALPKDIQEKIRNSFMDGTRRKRWELLKKHAPDQGIQLERDLVIAQKTHDVLVKQETQTEKHTKLRMAEKFELEQRYDLAVELYEEILESNPDDEDIKGRIKYIKGETKFAAHPEENPMIREALSALMQDGTISDEVRKLTILDVFGRTVERSQQITSAIKAEDRSAQQLDEEDKDVQEDILETTGGKYLVGRDGGLQEHELVRVDTGQLQSRDVSKFQRIARPLQGQRDKALHNIDLVARDGRILRHTEFKDHIHTQRESLKNDLAARIADKLGKKGNTEEIKKIKEAISDDDLEIKLT